MDQAHRDCIRQGDGDGMHDLHVADQHARALERQSPQNTIFIGQVQEKHPDSYQVGENAAT